MAGARSAAPASVPCGPASPASPFSGVAGCVPEFCGERAFAMLFGNWYTDPMVKTGFFFFASPNSPTGYTITPRRQRVLPTRMASSLSRTCGSLTSQSTASSARKQFGSIRRFTRRGSVLSSAIIRSPMLSMSSLRGLKTSAFHFSVAAWITSLTPVSLSMLALLAFPRLSPRASASRCRARSFPARWNAAIESSSECRVRPSRASGSLRPLPNDRPRRSRSSRIGTARRGLLPAPGLSAGGRHARGGSGVSRPAAGPERGPAGPRTGADAVGGVGVEVQG